MMLFLAFPGAPPQSTSLRHQETFGGQVRPDDQLNISPEERYPTDATNGDGQAPGHFFRCTRPPPNHHGSGWHGPLNHHFPRQTGGFTCMNVPGSVISDRGSPEGTITAFCA